MSVTLGFDAVARRYDSERRLLIPCFDAFYGAALDALSDISLGPHPTILDVGAGTGLLAAMVRERHPGVRLTLIDASHDMLEQARARFTDAQIAVVQGDYRLALPTGPFDAVVSALSIHHLEDDEKAALFRQILGVLRPGGIFVNADQVRARSAVVSERYQRAWLAAVAISGLSRQALAAALERQKHDRLGILEDQLAWLDEAGFVNTHCCFKSSGFVVMAAESPA